MQDNLLLVSNNFKQRTNSLGSPMDEILLSTTWGTIIRVEDEKAKEHYKPYICGGDKQINNMVDKHNQRMLTSRSHAYTKQSDPFFMEWQYDAATDREGVEEKKNKWLIAVESIKKEYPKIELPDS